MARHPNQKPMTVNAQRANQLAAAPKEYAIPTFDDLADVDTHFDFDQPTRMVGGVGLSLMMSGYARSGLH